MKFYFEFDRLAHFSPIFAPRLKKLFRAFCTLNDEFKLSTFKLRARWEIGIWEQFYNALIIDFNVDRKVSHMTWLAVILLLTLLSAKMKSESDIIMYGTVVIPTYAEKYVSDVLNFPKARLDEVGYSAFTV